MGSLPTRTEAVVFDCDGLLVDTEPCWTVAETALFAAHGHTFGPEQKALVIGRTVEAAAEAMADCFGRPGAGPELAAELLERVRKELAHGAAALPGAAELVRACRAAAPIAVASNSPRELLDTALDSAGLAPYISTRSPPTRCAPPSPHQTSTSRHVRHSVQPRSVPSPSRTRPRASPRHVPPDSTSRSYRPFPGPTSTTTGWAPAWATPNCWAGPGNWGTPLPTDPPLRSRATASFTGRSSAPAVTGPHQPAEAKLTS